MCHDMTVFPLNFLSVTYSHQTTPSIIALFFIILMFLVYTFVAKIYCLSIFYIFIFHIYMTIFMTQPVYCTKNVYMVARSVANSRAIFHPDMAWLWGSSIHLIFQCISIDALPIITLNISFQRKGTCLSAPLCTLEHFVFWTISNWYWCIWDEGSYLLSCLCR